MSIHTLVGLVSRCVRLCRENREQTPARAVRTDLGRFPGADGGRKLRQDKEQASSVTPCSVTSARSAGSYGGFRAFQSGVKIEGVLSLLRSSSPKAYSHKKRIGVMPDIDADSEEKGEFISRLTPSGPPAHPASISSEIRIHTRWRYSKIASQ